jgi:m7GpppX diphosphatase
MNALGGATALSTRLTKRRHHRRRGPQVQPEQMYCVAICHRRDVASLRELRAQHLPLLRNMRDKGLAAIQGRYGIPPGQVRAWLHYQPSYYHLHVHFAHVRHEGAGLMAGKAHLLADVIDALEACCGHVFERRTLTFVCGAADELGGLLLAAAGRGGEGAGGS